MFIFKYIFVHIFHYLKKKVFWWKKIVFYGFEHCIIEKEQSVIGTHRFEHCTIEKERSVIGSHGFELCTMKMEQWVMGAHDLNIVY